MGSYIVIVLFLFIIVFNMNFDKFLNYTYPYNFNPSFRNNLININEGFKSNNNNDLAISGFNGVFQNANSNYKKQIDSISLRHGSKTCSDTMLTNSMGYVCLTSDELKSLKTRGGNDVKLVNNFNYLNSSY